MKNSHELTHEIRDTIQELTTKAAPATLEFVHGELHEMNTQAIHRYAIFLGPIETFGLIPLFAGAVITGVTFYQQMQEKKLAPSFVFEPTWVIFTFIAVASLYVLLIPYRMVIAQSRTEEHVLEVATRYTKASQP
jgi:hypothetical protein